MKIMGTALCIVSLMGSVVWAGGLSAEALHLRHGDVVGRQKFEQGVVDWAEEVALVSGSCPVPNSTLPADHLRAKRAARISLWERVSGLFCELTGCSSPGNEAIPRGFFRETSVTEYCKDGSYVLEVAIPLKRLMELAEERP
ncbi:MAG: hypothetical protein CSA35_02195 [Dethiosulfovibrio peptidovorans]|nr:MAG: hypothetical protein CSA35_02195 [Dethiosulfovibrio peptidovorans]